jgi:dihydropteroate synthase
MSRLYHRPVDLAEGEAARTALSEGRALPLAGGGVHFQTVEVSERSGRRDLLPVSKWREEFPEAVDGVTARRATLAGLRVDRSLVMAVLNVTPDSFSDGGELDHTAAVLARARRSASEGADIWDVGGESTRPGSDPVSIDEEISRVLPAVTALVAEGSLPVSIDSRKPEVFQAAIAAGASIINDVAAMTGAPGSLETAVSSGAPVILMHAQGDPKTMQEEPQYDNVLFDVYDWLEERIKACEEAGLDRSQLVIDPGIGFGKTLDHNLQLLKNLTLFHGLGCLILLGVSRKSFIHKVRTSPDPGRRIGGSLAATLEGRAQGVQIFRTHDVHETVEALAVAEAIARGK